MTTRATTTTSNNSVGATSNIQLASPQEEGSELVVLVGRRRHRRDVGSALAFDMLRCGGGRNVIFRHALFEALYTLGDVAHHVRKAAFRSEEHTSELQSLMRISYAVFCLKQKNKKHTR